MNLTTSNTPSTVYLDPHTVNELEALKGKLASLQETLSSHIAYLKEPKYHFTWPDLLNKFNMFTAKFTSLSEDFYQYTQTGSTATLNKLMLHPWNPPATEQDTNIVSVLLRTKLIPTIEALERDTTRMIQQEIKPVDSSRKDQDQLTKEQLEQWKALRDRHDQLATNATAFIQQVISEHRESFFLRIEEDGEEEEDDDDEDIDLEGDSHMDDKKKTKEEPEWKQKGFPSEENWKKYKLECMMTFYSMGRSELAGSDLKPK